MSESVPHLSGLNDAQSQAVLHCAGPLLIFAGAGSGKTRVLVRRIAHLIHEGVAKPEEIFATTFTNKAALEMKHRVAKLFANISNTNLSQDEVPSTDKAPSQDEALSPDKIRQDPKTPALKTLPLWVSTFHSSCARILRSNAEVLGYEKNFVIYDSKDSLAALKRVYKKLKVDPRTIDPKEVRRQIDRAKNNYQFSDAFRDRSSVATEEARYSGNGFSTSSFLEEQSLLIADIFDAYQQELLDSNAMDFGDLLCNTVSLFQLEPKILDKYQERFRYIMVDEYQDTNHVQYLLVKLLASKYQNICVVGDDDQSIYAFRGACVENILNFQRDFPEVKVVTLEENYRSTQTILQAAQEVIEKNQRRQSKAMRTSNPQGSLIVQHDGTDEAAEAKFVAQEIATRLQEGSAASDIAVFYRTNAQSRALEEALCSYALPYEIVGGHKFYERKEIKDILAYLKLIVNPKDNESLLRIINVPLRGLGATSLNKLIQEANTRKISLLETVTLAAAGEVRQVSQAVAKKLSSFTALIKELQVDLELANTNFAVAELLQTIADKSGYLDMLRNEESPEAESRIENIHELLRVAVGFEKQQKDNTEGTLSVSDFLDRASLSSDSDQENVTGSDGDRSQPIGYISLMTLHMAKGLEFETVFLIGMEEGLLPHARSFEDRKALEEERRLCYVGITRAKKQLYLTRACSRQNFVGGFHLPGYPSRFLDDLPEELLEERS